MLKEHSCAVTNHIVKRLGIAYLDDKRFEKFGIVLIITGSNHLELLLSGLFHLTNQIILCLQELQPRGIQLCGILTAKISEQQIIENSQGAQSWHCYCASPSIWVVVFLILIDCSS